MEQENRTNCTPESAPQQKKQITLRRAIPHRDIIFVLYSNIFCYKIWRKRKEKLL